MVDDIPLKGNVPLGLMDDVKYNSVECEISPGDQVILVSDGILEARNLQAEEFGSQALLNAIRTAGTNSPEGTLKSIQSAVSSFTIDAQQHDDITLLIFSLHGAAAGPS